MRIAWHGFAFDLPADWEVTRYSIAPQAGRLEFNDRRGPLGVLSWEPCARPPDAPRILEDYFRRHLKPRDREAFLRFRQVQTLRIGPFLAGFNEDGQPCLALLHLARRAALLLWRFPDFRRQALEQTWRPILESFQANDGDRQAWAMFGIRCRLPREFELEQATCRPADAWLAFERRNLHRLDLHRWGLPRELLRGRDLGAFFESVVRGHEGRVLELRREVFRGMESVSAAAEVRGTRGMDRLYGAPWRAAGRLWHDAREKRLYAWLQASAGKAGFLEEKEFLPE